MMHGCFEGTATYLAANWAFLVFLLAADCELTQVPIPCSLIMLSNYSGDDPAGICHVESI